MRSRRPRERLRDILVFGLFLLSALSRWYGLTLPLVLIALDIYPLRRPCVNRLWVEKLPLFVVASMLATVTAIAKGSIGGYHAAMRPTDAALGIVLYLWKLAWPSGLIPLYTIAGAQNPLGLNPVLAMIIVSAITLGLLAAWRRVPALALGWACFLAGVAPPLLFLQPGPLFVSDHYLYSADIGLTLLAAGLLLGRRRLALLFLPLLLLLGALSHRQTLVWRDSETLWRHALSVDPLCYPARPNLADVCLKRGQIQEAIALLKEHLLLHPEDWPMRANLDALQKPPGTPLDR